jgi:hypothetical protein
MHLTSGHLMHLVIRSCAARNLIFAKVEVMKPLGWRGRDPWSPMRRARLGGHWGQQTIRTQKFKLKA